MATNPPAAAQQLDRSAPTPNVNDYDAEAVNHGSTKNVDELWIPVTTSRQTKGWYIFCHIVTTMVGAGVLALPAAVGWLGGIMGITFLVFFSWFSLHAVRQMVELHQSTEESPAVEVRRFSNYLELGQEAFGEKLGLFIVVPLQLVGRVGVTIVYMVTGGQSLFALYRLIRCPAIEPYDQVTKCGQLGPLAFIFMYSLQHFFLAQLSAFSFVSGISLGAAIISLGYSTIAWADILGEYFVNTGDSESYQIDYPGERLLYDMLFQMFSSLGILAFAYAGAHNVVLEIQATIPSTPSEKPPEAVMKRTVATAYVAVGVTYSLVGVAGLWLLGLAAAPVEGNVLFSLVSPRWLIGVANLLVMVHVTGLYVQNAMPVFDLLDTAVEKKLGSGLRHRLRSITRGFYVSATVAVACSLPFFDAWVGFVGGFALLPAAYVLPCIIWLKIRKPTVFSRSWLANWFFIVIGGFLAALGSMGGFQTLIAEAFNLYDSRYGHS